MAKIVWISLTTIILFFVTFSVSIAQSVLEKAQIEQYIATIAPLNTLARTQQSNEEQNYDSALQTVNHQIISNTPVTDGLDFLKAQSNYDEVVGIVTQAGFSSIEDWASVGDKIMMAYSAYYLKNPIHSDAPSIDEIKSDLNEQRIKIENNQFISGEQKQTLVNKIQNSMALLADPTYIDSENISVISPYIERLNALFKELP